MLPHFNSEHLKQASETCLQYKLQHIAVNNTKTYQFWSEYMYLQFALVSVIEGALYYNPCALFKICFTGTRNWRKIVKFLLWLKCRPGEGAVQAAGTLAQAASRRQNSARWEWVCPSTYRQINQLLRLYFTWYAITSQKKDPFWPPSLHDMSYFLN